MNAIKEPSVAWVFALIGLFLAMPAQPAGAGEAPLSEATRNCLACHETVSPGLVADWKKSRHAQTTPAEALKKAEKARLVSATQVQGPLAEVGVGCAECHGLDPASHKDTFDHEGTQVHAVVTPRDCATCHPTEVREYGQNKMARAVGNLEANTLYQKMVADVAGDWSWVDGHLTLKAPDTGSLADSCFFCHGTRIAVTGTATIEAETGTVKVPVLSGWPNQGVGRINPDESLGSCAACHTRHGFSQKMARQPYTCAQCHKGPDVPAYKVFEVSKHGNLFSAHKSEWNFDATPWTVGRDFGAPTCAACHVSQVVTPDGETLAKRTHRMNDRLPWRLLGLIYAHPQPKEADTSQIRNRAGLPLPTELTGEPVAEALIDPAAQTERAKTMRGLCRGCHSQGWIQGHFERLEHSIKTSNAATLTATMLMRTAWARGLAQGLDKGRSPFDEAGERRWAEVWLFYANSIRLAAAMGGADYGTFADGRWQMTRSIQELSDWLKK